MSTRNSRAILAEKAANMRSQNFTFRQIADELGYKSPASVYELLMNNGYFSIVFSKDEILLLIEFLEDNIPMQEPDDSNLLSVYHKLKKMADQAGLK